VLKTIRAGLFGGAISMRWAERCSQRAERDQRERAQRAIVATVRAASQRRIADNCCSTKSGHRGLPPFGDRGMRSFTSFLALTPKAVQDNDRNS
jgi:hypothetical protein